MPKRNFEKPAVPIGDQLNILTSRGLRVVEPDHATHYLRFIGYYRLSGYSRHYIDPSDPELKRFKEGANFDDVLELYIFDRKLRSFLMDAFERIEVAVKAVMSNEGGIVGGPFWLCDSRNFDHGQHDSVLDAIKRDCTGQDGAKSQHPYIQHFYLNYDNPFPPCWMILETLSFGSTSQIYKRAKGGFRIPVAKHFRLQHDVMESWLHALAFARNVCAHHGRTWNRAFTIRPKIPKEYKNHWPVESQNRLYVICGMIHHFMATIADGPNWSRRLRELIKERPNISLAQMGFPDNWEKSQFWDFG